jgi:hypothetical protein
MPAMLMQTAVALLTYAYGANWTAGRAQRDMLMFEYFSAWTHGDEYVYLETQNVATRSTNGATVGAGETTPYAEVHARLGGAVDAGPVRGLFMANQVDAGQGYIVFLSGAGLRWGGGVNTDLFLRYDPGLARPTWQAVTYGEWGFRIGPVRMRYGGYVKAVGAEGSSAPFLVSDTRLVWEPTRHLRTGVALRLWRNDSGVRGINQTVPEAILQWRF